MNYCITIDWLQTYCHANMLVEGVYYGEVETYKVKLTGQETAQFKRLYSVKGRKGFEIATIQQEPRTSVISPKTTLVKLSNRLLYHEGYMAVLYDLQATLSLVYKGITRLDICLDCNKLAGGRSVSRFLKQYVTSEPLQKGHIWRKGSNRFSCHGSRTQSSTSRITSLRWGSPSSRVSAYCYNKSLELIEVKDKPWIREMWERNGLVHQVDKQSLGGLSRAELEKQKDRDGLVDYVKTGVWRFEISIKSGGQDILNMATGELFKLSPKYLEHYTNIVRLFKIYAEKVLNFSINTGQKNVRNYERLVLFDIDEKITSKPYYQSVFLDTGRTEKVCYNKLRRISEMYLDLPAQDRIAIQEVMELLEYLWGVKAATIMNNRVENYLNLFRSETTVDALGRKYIETVRRVGIAKKDVDPDWLYYIMMSSEPEQFNQGDYEDYLQYVPYPINQDIDNF